MNTKQLISGLTVAGLLAVSAPTLAHNTADQNAFNDLDIKKVATTNSDEEHGDEEKKKKKEGEGKCSGEGGCNGNLF